MKQYKGNQHYLDLLKPAYNILKNAGSRLGSKHTEETIAKMKSRVWTDEQKAKLSDPPPSGGLKKLHSSEDHRERISKFIESRSQRVEVLDTLTNQIIVYPSIREAARGIEYHVTSI